jgi:hypothetical protein
MAATEASEPPEGLARVLAEVTVRIARESIGAGAAPNEVAFQVNELLASFGEATSSAGLGLDFQREAPRTVQAGDEVSRRRHGRRSKKKRR